MNKQGPVSERRMAVWDYKCFWLAILCIPINYVTKASSYSFQRDKETLIYLDEMAKHSSAVSWQHPTEENFIYVARK